jgi:hypothetical protein
VDSDEFFRLADNPQFIEGIYNYCDRWCERCPFTARCLNYAMEREFEPGAAGEDVRRPAFGQMLQGIFEQTVEMLTRIAAERGIDLNASSPEAEAEAARHRRRQVKARNQPLARQAMNYARMVDAWFKANRSLFRQKADDLNTIVQLGLAGLRPDLEALDVNDAVEIIRWYQTQIHVKLARALSSRREERELPEDLGFPSDADGSAKVALIGMDRSIAAWARLHRQFPGAADAVLDLLLHLDRLRRRTEARFPGARAFKRPGFDDETEAK